MIFLDMDGVIADFCSAAHAIHGKTYEGSCKWNFYEEWGLSGNEFWKPINEAGEDFWADLEPYPWADELIRAVRHVDPDFTICTSPSQHPSCVAGKVRWMEKHIGPNPRYIMCRDKWLLAYHDRLLIDDSRDNYYDFESRGGSGGEAVLFPQPWNGGEPETWRHVVYPALDRV